MPWAQRSCGRQASLVMEANLSPLWGILGGDGTRSRQRDGEYEESSVTRGLDFFKPYKKRFEQLRMDAKA